MRKPAQVAQQVEELVPTFAKLLSERAELPRHTRRSRPKLEAVLRNRNWNQDQIDAALLSQSPLIAARRYVAAKIELSYDSVAEYHRDWLRSKSS